MVRTPTLLAAALALIAGPSLTSPGAAESATSHTVASRATDALARAAGRPIPSATCTTPPVTATDPCINGKLSQALALLALDRSKDDLTAGNALVADAVAKIPHLKGFGSPGGLAGISADDFHFGPGPLIVRIALRFGAGAGTNANRLSTANQSAARDLLADWAIRSCRVADADPATVWTVYGSENHEAMENDTCWGAAEILARDANGSERRYGDGSTAREQLQAWSRFLARYIVSRAANGTLVEYASVSYAPASLQNDYNYADFASDARLRRLARDFLNLWWANWAQSELHGITGEPQARGYLTHIGDGTDCGDWTSYAYFSPVEAPPGAPAPDRVMALTSGFEPDPAIVALATQPRDGAYEVRSRGPGFGTSRVLSGTPHYVIDPRRAIARYVYVDRYFTVGTAMMPKAPRQSWVAISDQNRWDGVRFASNAKAVAFALPQPAAKTYNGVWGVADRATQIVQKIAAPDSTGAGPMQVYVWSGLKREERRGWIFATDNDAYVGVHPVGATVSWQPGGRSLGRLSRDTAPVVIQAGDRTRYPTLAAFERAVLALPLRTQPDLVAFRGLDSAELRFYPKSGRLPEIGGKPIDLDAANAFESPYVNERAGSGTVRITSPGHTATLRF